MRNCCLILFLLVCANLSFAQKDTLYFSSHENSRVSIYADYSYQCKAVSPLRGELRYWAAEIPSWLHFNASAHTLSGTAGKAGQYRIQLFASNGKDTVHQFFMLTVSDSHTVNILPLGNSITNGTSVYNSYRRDLWFLLHRAGINFDLIGSSTKQWMGVTMPDEDFDMDHEGHSGWTTANILNPPIWDSASGRLQDWLLGYTPGIVLLELGTNDVFQCVSVDSAINNLKTIISLIRQKNKYAKFLVAQIPPLGNRWAPQKLCGTDLSYGTVLSNFNGKLLSFAKMIHTKESPVIVVDQYTGVNASTDMYDDIHPNRKGEKEMAERWYRAMIPFLPKLKQ